MNIYNTLKSDHKKVDELFEKIISSKSADIWTKYFEALKIALLAHAEAEHKTFYQAKEYRRKRYFAKIS